MSRLKSDSFAYLSGLWERTNPPLLPFRVSDSQGVFNGQRLHGCDCDKMPYFM